MDFLLAPVLSEYLHGAVWSVFVGTGGLCVPLRAVAVVVVVLEWERLWVPTRLRIVLWSGL